MSIRRKNRQRNHEEADINITPFMNLMIALVPILLLNMTFVHLKGIELTIPELNQVISTSREEIKKEPLSIIVRDTTVEIRLPQDKLLTTINSSENDFTQELTDYLLKVKHTLTNENIIVESSQVLIEPNVTHQKIIYVVDAIKNPKLIDSNQNIFFNNLIFGDAPILSKVGL
ncbi:MAG: biopolymer transporter ExbD [Pseudomonadota bacterium]